MRPRHACLGEDSINFAFNQHLLVREISKRMPDGRVKILDLSWSAITDENDVIQRLMLCVRDVTELRKLAAQASEQHRRLDMIGEILAVSEEKFHHFIESSAGFVSENERIIRKHSEADHAAIAELFRNMHTIKGNARTYNLQHLTNVVHETEQSYHELRQPDADRCVGSGASDERTDARARSYRELREDQRTEPWPQEQESDGQRRQLRSLRDGR